MGLPLPLIFFNRRFWITIIYFFAYLFRNFLMQTRYQWIENSLRFSDFQRGKVFRFEFFLDNECCPCVLKLFVKVLNFWELFDSRFFVDDVPLSWNFGDGFFPIENLDEWFGGFCLEFWWQIFDWAFDANVAFGSGYYRAGIMVISKLMGEWSSILDFFIFRGN